MDLDELTTARIARYDAEIKRENANAQLAKVAFDQADQRAQAAMEKQRAIHAKNGLDLDQHMVLIDDQKQQDGTTLPAGRVLVRKDGSLYVPPPAPPETKLSEEDGARLLEQIKAEGAKLNGMVAASAGLGTQLAKHLDEKSPAAS